MKTRHHQILIEPAQTTPWVFGLRGRPPSSPCSIDRDTSLSMMDAPDLLPAGSMISVSYFSDFSIQFESNIRRDAK